MVVGPGPASGWLSTEDERDTRSTVGGGAGACPLLLQILPTTPHHFEEVTALAAWTLGCRYHDRVPVARTLDRRSLYLRSTTTAARATWGRWLRRPSRISTTCTHPGAEHSPGALQWVTGANPCAGLFALRRRCLGGVSASGRGGASRQPMNPLSLASIKIRAGCDRLGDGRRREPLGGRCGRTDQPEEAPDPRAQAPCRGGHVGQQERPRRGEEDARPPRREPVAVGSKRSGSLAPVPLSPGRAAQINCAVRGAGDLQLRGPRPAGLTVELTAATPPADGSAAAARPPGPPWPPEPPHQIASQPLPEVARGVHTLGLQGSGRSMSD